MDRTLTGFVRALRAAGAEASTAETLDAARAMALVGFADRETLKASLAVALAKSQDEKLICERVFEQYFSLPADPADSPDSDKAPGAGDGSDPGLRTGQPELDALLDLADGRSPGQTAAALMRAAQAVGVDDIRFASQIPYLTRRTMEALGIAALEARLQQAAAGAADAVNAETASLGAARDRLQRQVRALVEQRFELFGRPATEAFMTEVAVQRPLGRMSPPDMDRMKAAVARMAKRLAAKHSRRRRVLLRGQLDFRRTLRANAGHDSVPVDLHFKHRRRDKPRIVVICDVSGSVSDLRSFAFSHELKDVAAPLETVPFDDAMALILSEVGGGATDYGQALADLREHHWDCIDGRTTVLVLGDGRSNHSDPRLDLFAELADRAKRVVWLCPEPAGRWGSGDSEMLRFRPFCTHVSHCATASDLEQAIDEALAAYG
jgi:uncharacterized protein with von Willebrand factor type A (vWA) domain